MLPTVGLLKKHIITQVNYLGNVCVSKAFLELPEPDALDAFVSTGGCDNGHIHPALDLLDRAIGINRRNGGIIFPGIGIAVSGCSSAISMRD